MPIKRRTEKTLRHKARCTNPDILSSPFNCSIQFIVLTITYGIRLLDHNYKDMKKTYPDHLKHRT